MIKTIIISVISLFMVSCISPISNKTSKDYYSQYVNPFIGTAYNGHTFPGACVPFGLIQASPETGNYSWEYCSGYNIEDDSIIGFAQTHLSGTGCQDLGDILLLPFVEKDKIRYKSKYDKVSQEAHPGYYKVHLNDFDIDVELTSTKRTAFHRYVYNSNKPSKLLIDFQNGIVFKKEQLKTHVLSSEISIPDSNTIIGHQIVENWIKRQYFFVIKFDKAYSKYNILPKSEGEKSQRMVFNFNLSAGDTLNVKIGLSTVSIDGAINALNKENPDWNFKRILQKAENKWEKILSLFDVNGTEEEKTNFYTSLYHLFIHPNDISDIDGRYRAVNDSVYHSQSGTFYSTFSLWDTFRAAHPLYTILCPKEAGKMVQSMIEHYNVCGQLPIWTLWGQETYCMIGNHAIPVIVDAYLKGIEGFNIEEAYSAIKWTSLNNHKGSEWNVYEKYGYYPFDIIKNESVSKTLESSYDDYCIAIMAKHLNRMDDYLHFKKRSQFYKNLFDYSSGLMRGKDSNGKWRYPFDNLLLSHAATSGGDYTEGNAWQYTWHVQHDIEELIQLMGGESKFSQKLDSLFFIDSQASNTGFVMDVTGLIGQYAHGNEPSHHITYLYNYVGQSYKTQQLIREIFDRFYQPKPDGLCGNDDCGQMSAWYIFSAMGFYPVNPISGEYIIGAPQIKEITINLPNGKKFIVHSKELSKENKYIKSITLNGKPINGYKIKHSDIINGGILEYTMSNKNNLNQ